MGNGRAGHAAASDTTPSPPAAPQQTPALQPPAEPADEAESPAAATPPEDTRRIAAKIVRYAQRLLQTYDRNGDGRLQQQEWQAMHGTPRQADLNHDGIITTEELAHYVADYGRRRRIRLLPQPGDLVDLPPLLHPTTAETTANSAAKAAPPSSSAPAASEEPAATPPPKNASRKRDTKFYVSPERLPTGLPDWFLARDRDGDSQLTLSEYSPKSVPAELQQFQRMDRNGDGVLTAAECVRPAAPAEKIPATK